MLPDYSVFYRKRGIRVQSEISAPRMQPLHTLVLPALSIFHYLDFQGQSKGPDSQNVYFQGNEKSIFVDHVAELTLRNGNPKRAPFAVDSEMRDYANAHRRTRRMREITGPNRDRETLIVYNYAFLNFTERYVRSFYTAYYKWQNTIGTLLDKIAEIEKVSQRQHFIPARIPRFLPSVSQLDASQAEFNETSLKAFRDEDAFMLLELWKFLGPEKNKSLFSRVPRNTLEKINLVYIEDALYTVVNLGQLLSWKNETKMLTPEEAPGVMATKAKTTLQPVQLQKRLLGMMMAIMETRTLASKQPALEPAPKTQSKLVQKLTADEDATEGEETPGVDQSDLSEQQLVEDVSQDQSQDELMLDEDDAAETGELTHEERIAAEDKRLDEALAGLNEIAARQQSEAVERETTLKQLLSSQSEVDLSQEIRNLCTKLADDNSISAGEYKKHMANADAYKRIMAPGGKQTLDEFVKIKPEELLIQSNITVPDSDSILDKSMLQSSLLDFDSRYIREYLHKDVAGMVLNIQKAGYAVTDYKVDIGGDVMGEYYDISFDVAPVIGKPGRLRVKVPVIQEDGTYRANGTNYRLRKQRGDLPIRKVRPARVALTSYYGKAFVNRSKRKVNDYGHWLLSQVMLIGLDANNPTITNLMTSEVFDNAFRAPRAYSAIAQGVSSFESQGIEFYFDRQRVLKEFNETELKRVERNGAVIVGRRGADTVVMDRDNAIYVSVNGGGLQLIGNFLTFLGLREDAAPVESATLAIFGKDIPVGVILAYGMGLDKLMRLLGVEPRRVPAGTRLNLMPNEYAIAFSDETLVFDRDNRLAAMILAGFNEYHRSLKIFSAMSFNNRGVYLTLLEDNDVGARYLRELDLLYKLFVDPITHSLLVEMKEPTDFSGLLISACQKLLTDDHPDELDPAFMRDKGYERVAGAMYAKLVESIRMHNSKFAKGSAGLDLGSYSVWKYISEDPTKMQVKEINPIESLKDVEAVTLAGTGGRSKRSMTKETRAFHKNDIGLTSEATSDSSDVAINIFTSANPNYISLRGRSKRFDFKERPTSSLFSTSALNAVGADRDDPKRINFISIQNSHAVACEGYHQHPVRTGYDLVIPHRTREMFAKTAKQAGEVIALNKLGVIVRYEDGLEEGYAIGRVFGNSAGMTIPHEIVTTLKMGDKFALGDPIVYNTGFFEPDFFNPKQIVHKASLIAKTVLWEAIETLDDASGISQTLSKKLTTRVSEPKVITVRFDQSISNLVGEGDLLDSESILCIIEDASTASAKIFDEQTIQTLRAVGAATPKAHMKGKVERIEVFYNGEKEEMTPSLRAIADQGDKDLKKRANATGKHVYTGLAESLRIDNNPLLPDQMAIRIYITTDVGMGVGDKSVIANQMKTIVSEVNQKPYYTEDGEEIHGRFGMQSIHARIVNSAQILGTTNTLLQVIAKRMIEAYEEA